MHPLSPYRDRDGFYTTRPADALMTLPLFEAILPRVLAPCFHEASSRELSSAAIQRHTRATPSLGGTALQSVKDPRVGSLSSEMKRPP
jgi:hypothetical protein